MDVITGDFRELASCNAMSLSRSGDLAFIAGRRSYGLIHLDNPTEILKRVSRSSKYDVSEVQFSSEKDTLVAVASNDKIELLDWKEGADFVCEGVLKAHTRAITDLSWHRQQTNLLASGSIDNFIYVWDIRETRTPAFTLPAVTGASQVCFERTSGKYLATAHEGEIKLWDLRRGSTPALYINAHYSKIYSLDFSPHRPDQMVSSSADNTVKIWSISRPRSAEHTIKVPRAPVWKVRYTPFGDGLVTLVLNTLVRRENNLMLWNTHNLMSPVHTFYGHTDMVLEFGWRTCNPASDRHDYQLVTWSKDTTMKLWPISGNLKTMCGEETDLNDVNVDDVNDLDDAASTSSNPIQVSSTSSLEGEDSGFVSARKDPMTSSYDSTYGAATLDPDSMLAGQGDDDTTAGTSLTGRAGLASSASTAATKSLTAPSNLKQEFKLINFGDRLVLESLDYGKRYCVVVAETTKHTIYLNVKFPEMYPIKAAPIFSLMTGTTLDQNRGYHLLRKLRLTAQKQVNKNRRCLELCLRQFEQDIDLMHQEEQEELASADVLRPSVSLGGFQDSNVPYPRTSGARFCGTGQLVCFGWSYTVKFASIANPLVSSRAMKTPRALSAVSSGQLCAGTPPQFVPQNKHAARVRFSRTKSRISSTGSSISEDVKMAAAFGGRTVSESDPQNRLLGDGGPEESRGTVTIYDVLPLWPFSTELAQRYIVLGDNVEETCRYNASVALSAGHKEIARAWALAGASCAFAPTGSLGGNGCLTSSRRRTSLSASSSSTPQFYQSDANTANSCAVDPQPWDTHPLGRPLLLSLVAYFARSDIQTTAMLCCVFSYRGCLGRNCETVSKTVSPSSKSNLSPGNVSGRKKNSKSECSVVGDLEAETTCSRLRHTQSVSVSQSLEDVAETSWSDFKKPENGNTSVCHAEDCHKYVLDSAQSAIYDCFMKAYAELLSRLGLLIKSTEVNKCISAQARINDPERENLGTMLVSCECFECGRPLTSKPDRPSTTFCRHCKKRPVCTLCNMPVDGLTAICLDCGHGGHAVHMKQWFESHVECPSGCGCCCTAMV